MGEESKARRGELGKRRPTYRLKEETYEFLKTRFHLFN
jgi:hypothetical protein